MHSQHSLWTGLVATSRLRHIVYAPKTQLLGCFCRQCCTPAAKERERDILVHELKRKHTRQGGVGDVELQGEPCPSTHRMSSQTFHSFPSLALRASGQPAWENKRRTPFPKVVGSLALIVFIVAHFSSSSTIHADSAIHPSIGAGIRSEELKIPPTFRLSEISKHGPDDSSQWIVRGNRVYDITDFIPGHPGGEVILRACGRSIDPYWNIFSIHKKQEVFEILEQYYIGDVDPRDLSENGEADWSALASSSAAELADPFVDDPERDESLVMHTSKPCNAETPAHLLTDSFITPLKLFFVRNHLWVPRIDPSTHKVVVQLLNGDMKEYTLADLKKFREHTVTVTLQCAGNRRAHMSGSTTGATSGLQWDIGAIGTAEFTGVRLRDILCDAGYDFNGPYDDDDDAFTRHVHFRSPGDTYVASIPLLTAISPTSDVLLAYKMNGEVLPRDHGGPLRAIVPGTVAARSVKWLGQVSIEPEEAESQWQKRDYKCFGPNVSASDVTESDWNSQASIQELPVQSAITSVKKSGGDDGCLHVQGYAMSGGGRDIVRVDVSADGGRTWEQAQLRRHPTKGPKWAWTLWSLKYPKEKLESLGKEKNNFVVKAVDEAYNTQPEGFDSIWNFRGLLGNAWHRVTASSEN